MKSNPTNVNAECIGQTPLDFVDLVVVCNVSNEPSSDICLHKANLFRQKANLRVLTNVSFDAMDTVIKMSPAKNQRRCTMKIPFESWIEWYLY
jgi:hypothetical protein